MPSSDHRPNDGVVKRPSKPSDHNPHFFKVILADALKKQKLEIPRKFVKEYGLKAFVTNQTRLVVADGKEWNVGLTRSNGRVWFQHGWQKFVEFYALKLGYFLVFKYECQSSSFEVVIFDLTATEIEYPKKKIHLDDAEVKVKRETCLDDLEPVSYSQAKKTLDFKVGKVNFGAMEQMNNKRKFSSTISGRARAKESATAFQSMTLNPSFMCKISPSHIHPGKSLNVPRSFVEVHLEEPTEIILQVSDGRTWGARSAFYMVKKVKRAAELRNGWRNFVMDNNLKVGDHCVFEMIRKSSRSICFKVEIFRAS